MLWWVAEPIAYMAALYFVFAIGFRMGGEDFVPFLLVGTTTWRWFNGGVQNCSDCITGNVGLMNQVYFPKWILVAISVTSSTMKFSFVVAFLFLFLIVSGYEVTVTWFGVLAVVMVQCLLIIGVGGLLACIVPFAPDIKILIDNSMLILFFMSGIFFDITERPEHVQDILFLNPMAGIIQSYRECLMYGNWPNWEYLAVVAIASVLAIALTVRIMASHDRAYAKVVN